MADNIKKLIAAGRWLSIAEAPRECTGLFLIERDPEYVHVAYVTGGEWFLPFASARSEEGTPYLSEDEMPTHFRPVPDDCLADVAEHYDAALRAVLSMAESMTETSGVWAALHEFIEEALSRANEIAEGE